MSSPKETLLSTLTQTQPSQILLLQSFIQAPSPNPPGDTTAAAKIITTHLSSLGIPFDTLSASGQETKPNIVSEFHGGAGPGPRIVLNGHIDHFPVDPSTLNQWDRNPYSGDIQGDRMHGRGVVDMKSGTCSSLLAYCTLYTHRQYLRGSVALCAVSDEETGGKFGTQFLISQDKQKWGGDVMLSAEPSGKTVRFSEKGTLRLIGRVRTRGAHGAYLNLSQGAIRTSSTFLSNLTPQIEALAPFPPPELSSYLTSPTVLSAVDKAMGPGTSSIIAKPTLNIGTISGGVKVNMIPDFCSFELDIRLPVGLVAETVLSVIEDEKKKEKYGEASIGIEVQKAASNPASYSDINHPIIPLIQKNAEFPSVGFPGEKAVAIPSMGATDCKHYRYAGIPAFVYGCSPLTMASVNESASIEEFLHVTRVHALAVWDYLAA